MPWSTDLPDLYRSRPKNPNATHINKNPINFETDRGSLKTIIPIRNIILGVMY